MELTITQAHIDAAKQSTEGIAYSCPIAQALRDAYRLRKSLYNYAAVSPYGYEVYRNAKKIAGGKLSDAAFTFIEMFDHHLDVQPVTLELDALPAIVELANDYTDDAALLEDIAEMETSAV